MKWKFDSIVVLGIVLLIVFAFGSCKKETYENPYQNIEEEDPTMIEDSLNIDPASIAGLHANIFSKTCANSGCHDGNFEPDFRTIESSYNTLVGAPIIKNDPQGSFEFRVVKGEVSASQLVARLEYDIDGNSGIMPLVIDPGNDWEAQKATYIQNVKDWIAGGAKDVFGN